MDEEDIPHHSDEEGNDSSSGSHQANHRNHIPPEDDLYAVLGVDRTATADEIKTSYRQRSRMFHPDKHSTLDAEMQKDAVSIFNRIKTAHDILTDEHMRAVYDTLGIEGVKALGELESNRQIILRTKTPKEIREEYEEMIREKEKRRLEQRSNPKGTVVVGINASDLFDLLCSPEEEDEFDDDDDDDEDDGDNHEEGFRIPRVEVRQLSISQSIDLPLSLSENASLSGNMLTSNGKGSGHFGTSYRRILSHRSWVQVQFLIGQGPVFVIKGFRSLGEKNFSTGNIMVPVHIHGNTVAIAPVIEGTMGRHFTKTLVGYLTLKAGVRNAIVTSFVYNPSMYHHITFTYQYGLRESFVSVFYTRKFDVNNTKVKVGSKVGTKGFNVEYGMETKSSPNSVVGASVVIGLPSGVTLKVKLTYANQTFVFDILLNDEILPSAIFYGTLFPIVGYAMAKKFLIDPYQASEERKEKEDKKRQQQESLSRQKKEAIAVLSLWKATYDKTLEHEERVNGLIIKEALYGKSSEVELIRQLSEDDRKSRLAEDSCPVIDVHICLQCQVKDSILTLPAVSKANSLGFFDPCFGDSKKLYIKYSLKGAVNEVTIDDVEPLKIPPNTAHNST